MACTQQTSRRTRDCRDREFVAGARPAPGRGLFERADTLLSANCHVGQAVSTLAARLKEHPLSTLDFDLDISQSDMELEWRRAYDSLIVARAEYQALAANPEANADHLDSAHTRLYQAEASKARVMARLDAVEASAGASA
jgi:hypothetical protein